MTGEGARAERHVLDAQEVRDFLQNHVVQGRRNEEGNYGARGRRARVPSSAARSSHARSPPLRLQRVLRPMRRWTASMHHAKLALLYMLK